MAVTGGARGLRLRWAFGPIATAAALTGFGLAIIVIVPRGILGDGGVGGGDAHAYWLAGRNILANANLYFAGSGEPDAYLYPPPFAQLIAPAAGFVSATWFVWIWRIASVACLVIAAGGWRAAGIALLVFPPAIVELDTGNVSFQLAAICALVMRGHAFALPFAFVLKLAGAGAAPIALVRDRGGFLSGIVIAALVVGASFVLSPALWSDYARFLSTAEPMEYWTNVGRDIPLLVRLLLAVGFGIVATRWIVLVPVAFLLSMPILALHSFAILVCAAPTLSDWLVRRVGGLPIRAASSTESALRVGGG